ncbi:MAG: response regulator [Bacteriovoracaceae bacterium]|nr:response regulator [Bacteriovoracaceae bacterium]
MEKIFKESSILIVDDEKCTIGLMQNAVGKHFGCVYTAGNGREALDVLSRVHIDLALIDIKMPVMDGFELIGLINKNYPEIIKIVLTANGDIDNLKLAIKLNIFNFIEKPSRISTIIEQVKSGLKKRHRSKIKHKFQYNQLLNKIGYPLCVIDEELNIVNANQDFCNAFRSKERGFGNVKCYNVLGCSINTKENSQVCPLLNGKANASVERKIKNHNGIKVPYYIKLYKHMDALDNHIGIIGSFENREYLRDMENDKEKLNLSLEEKHITIRNILEEKNVSNDNVKQFVMGQVSNNIIPLVDNLKSTLNMTANEYSKIQLIEKYLKNICGDFSNKMDELVFKLTKTEQKICQLIKSGYTRVEIAGTLHISEGTVRNHSTNIRKKLGLNKKKMHLKQYLGVKR